jgi:hypothetical protein
MRRPAGRPGAGPSSSPSARARRHEESRTAELLGTRALGRDGRSSASSGAATQGVVRADPDDPRVHLPERRTRIRGRARPARPAGAPARRSAPSSGSDGIWSWPRAPRSAGAWQWAGSSRGVENGGLVGRRPGARRGRVEELRAIRGRSASGARERRPPGALGGMPILAGL